MTAELRDGKKDAQMPFRVTAEMAEQLRAVALANDADVQDLLREAARAILRAQVSLGWVPKDMEIIQRTAAPVAPPADMAAALTQAAKHALAKKDGAAGHARATPRART